MEESKEYSWAWVTADRLLSLGPCELVSIAQTSSGNTSDVTYYDGENTTGDIILIMEALANRTAQFCPHVPIYCRRGLYVDIGNNVTGCFVMWRELSNKKG